MSYITDIYKFTKAINDEAGATGRFPEVATFNTQYADRYLEKNRRYAEQIAALAQSDKYNLIYKEYGRYYLTLRGYNLVKRRFVLRPGLLFFIINETKQPTALVLSVIAILVSIASIIFNFTKG